LRRAGCRACRTACVGADPRGRAAGAAAARGGGLRARALPVGLFSTTMPDAFDVESTNAVKEDKLRDFLNSTLEPELGSIPMVGPATVKALEEAGIKNSVSARYDSEPA